MILKENPATRKELEADKVAVCPVYGCNTVKRLKTLKFGIFGLKKYPICPNHRVYLVFIDEFIGDFLESVLACLFDDSLIPPNQILKEINRIDQKQLVSFIHTWMYCSIIGRGIKEIPNYIESLSKAYINSLNKSQKKAIMNDLYIRKKNRLIKLGFKKIKLEYINFLKVMYSTHEGFYDYREIRPLSLEVNMIINDWLNNYIKNLNYENSHTYKNPEKNNIENKKIQYDKYLHARTCLFLLGKINSKLPIKISGFEIFAAYHDFLANRMHQKYNPDWFEHFMNSNRVFLSKKSRYSSNNKSNFNISEKNNCVLVTRKQELFDDKKQKLKECGRCHQILPYSEFFKVTTNSDKVRPYCKNCHSELGLIYKNRKKLEIILKEFDGRCVFCKNDFTILPALQFHHKRPKEKTTSWRKINKKNKNYIIDKLNKEKILLVCSNCHLKQQADIFYEYKEFILKPELFELKTEDINKILFDLTNQIDEKLERMHKRQKIREWVKKRFIIESLYDGKCIGCEEVSIFDDLPSLEFHHRKQNYRRDKSKWEDIQHLKSKDIINILIRENCVCLCSNCHSLIHSRFNEFREEIIKDFFDNEDIRRINEKIYSIFDKIKNNIKKFEFSRNNNILKNPLTLKIPHSEVWKKYLVKIYNYLMNNDKVLFGAYELKKEFKITPRHIYKHLNRFIEEGFIIRDNSQRGRFLFTEKGYNKIEELKKAYPDLF